MPICISNQLKCNGRNDCLDGEDEKDCKSKTCGSKEVKRKKLYFRCKLKLIFFQYYLYTH